jgi:hypothetical protein
MIKIISKMSLYLFKDVIKLFEPKLNTLKKTLNNSELNIDVVTYLSNILFLSFLCFLIFEFGIIILLIYLKIYFNLISFLVTMFISFTFSIIFFMILFKYPYYIIISKKQKIEKEIQKSIKHLNVLKDPNMTVKDVLLLLQKIESNDILTKESKNILSMTDLNHNLKSTLEYIRKKTYSEVENDFLRKLIEVIDKKKTLKEVVKDFLESVEQNIKEENEQRKANANMLFVINVFLFFFIFVLLLGVFFVPMLGDNLRTILMVISFVFPILEILLLVILNK